MTVNWIALIACVIVAAWPTEPSLPSTIGTLICIVAAVFNAYVIGMNSQ